MRKLCQLFVGLVVATAALAVGVSSAAAQGVLDQSFTSNNGAGVGIEDGTQFAQTFTAGITGRLTRVDVFLDGNTGFPAPPVTVDIESVNGNHEPSGTVLATGTITANEIQTPSFTWVPTVFATPPASVAGTQYAIVLSDSAATFPNLVDWGFDQNTYAGGYGLIGNNGTWFPQPNFSGDFKTYVESEPTSIGQCMNGGWHNFPQFKNEGLCVAFVETGK